MISAKIDRPKLERSLKSAAKKFGETTKQAVVRWGVSTCRDLAVQTQVWGTSKTRVKQEGAILSDALNCIYTRPNVGASNKRGLFTPQDVNDWIEINRTRRRARVAKLPISEKRVCTPEVLKAALKIRNARAGMAKGGWLGAGKSIAAKQTGMDRINIGKNFLSYAQKHGSKGNAKVGTSLFNPIAELHNGWAHTASKHVLSSRGRNEAIAFGLKKTLTWYKKSAKKALDSA